MDARTSPAPNKIMRVLALIFFLSGAAWSAAGAHACFDEYLLRKRGQPAVATVTQRYEDAFRGKNVYLLGYEFTLPGQQTSIPSGCGWNQRARIKPREWARTATDPGIAIIYDPNEPCRNRPVASPDMYLEGLSGAGVGATGILLAVWMWRQANREA